MQQLQLSTDRHYLMLAEVIASPEHPAQLAASGSHLVCVCVCVCVCIMTRFSKME